MLRRVCLNIRIYAKCPKIFNAFHHIFFFTEFYFLCTKLWSGKQWRSSLIWVCTVSIFYFVRIIGVWNFRTLTVHALYRHYLLRLYLSDFFFFIYINTTHENIFFLAWQGGFTGPLRTPSESAPVCSSFRISMVRNKDVWIFRLAWVVQPLYGWCTAVLHKRKYDQEICKSLRQ